MSLSSADLSHLEAVLAQGKRPRVMFTDAAGQVAGKTGKVVALESERDGDFVVVAFGADQLPFSPAELRLPQRGEAARAKPPRQRPAEPEPKAPTGPGLLPEDPAPTAIERKSTSVTDTTADTAPDSTAAAPAPRKKAAKPRAAKDKHPELTVTLTYEDGEWAVAAAKGARTVVKGSAVPHTAALSMCAAAGAPEVDALVTEVVERIRSEAEEEAAAARKRLEQAEARLAELG